MKPKKKAMKRPTKAQRGLLNAVTESRNLRLNDGEFDGLTKPGRVAETRKRLSLYEQAEAAERKLFDAQAVETAARRFWERAQADVSRAQVELDTAR